MKRLFFVPIAFGLMVGCTYDDTELRHSIEQIQDEQEQMQEQIDAQQALLNALANNLTIINVAQTEDGFVVNFSDGSTITIKHGKDGEKGEQGEQGEKGDTGEQGEQGEPGDTFFTDVIVGEDEVTFILADGTEITIPLSGSDEGGNDGDGDFTDNPVVPANNIWYTTKYGYPIELQVTEGYSGKVMSHTYEDGYGKIVFDDDVTTIPLNAFRDCTTLTNVYLPECVRTIGYEAFYSCDSLTSITIPDSVTSIGNMAFYDCTSLPSITIPDSVTSIGDCAFNGCSSLTSFYGKFASDDNRCLIVDGKLIAFAPAGVTEYTIPDSVTSIGSSAFYCCDSLTSVTIPDSVTSIGNWAFSGCTSLTSVTIGDSVTSIGQEAFSSCTSLTSVYCKPTTPPTAIGYSWYAFNNNASGRKIYVPAASVEAYRKATGWSGYADDIVGYEF